MNLVVVGESVHEGDYLTSSTIIDDLFNERCWVIILRICFIHILEVSTYVDGGLFLIYWNGV